ncbi:MAG: sporulation protein YabP [Lachnospiraceae bacterium]|nr:sporulation protein YabP [Lachnospiraceae bacterium]
MEEIQSLRGHKIIMTGRKSLQITGVKDVREFDEKETEMETSAGMLNIKGEGLHVRNLNLERGEVDMDGMVNNLTYTDITSFKKKSESLLSRMFK